MINVYRKTDADIKNCFLVVIDLESNEIQFIGTSQCVFNERNDGLLRINMIVTHYVYIRTSNVSNGKVSLLKTVRTSLIAVAKFVVHIFEIY